MKRDATSAALREADGLSGTQETDGMDTLWERVGTCKLTLIH